VILIDLCPNSIDTSSMGVALGILVARIDHSRELLGREDLHLLGLVGELRRLQADCVVLLDPIRAVAEPEERAQPLEVLVRRQRPVGPRRAELPQRVDVELPELLIALVGAPGEQPLVQEVLVLADRRRLELPRDGVVEVLLDGSRMVGTSSRATPTWPLDVHVATSSLAASQLVRSSERRTVSPPRVPSNKIGHEHRR
jgi:hypothetical protein